MCTATVSPLHLMAGQQVEQLCQEMLSARPVLFYLQVWGMMLAHSGLSARSLELENSELELENYAWSSKSKKDG